MNTTTKVMEFWANQIDTENNRQQFAKDLRKVAPTVKNYAIDYAVECVLGKPKN